MDAPNLPELLAQDLTLSEEIFKRKDMSSGAPAPTLATYTGMDTFAVSASQHQSRQAYGYLNGISGGQTLGSIREQCSHDHIANLQNHSTTFGGASDASSLECSPMDSPLSPLQRGESVATVATSVQSNGAWLSDISAKAYTKRDRINSGAFLDFGDGNRDDSDTEDEDEKSGRPILSRGDSGIEVPPASPSIQEHDVLDPPPNIGRKPRPKPPALLIPSRSASARRPVTGDSDSSYSPRTTLPPRVRVRRDMSPSSPKPTISDAPGAPGALTVPSVAETRANTGKPPLRIELPTADVNAFPRLSPFSPAASVQTWLDTNIVHSPMPHESDAAMPEDVPFGVSGLPLPQSVLNTLTISTLYFPETMLLSSSLSIETIRSYARKMRQPAEQEGGGGRERLTPPRGLEASQKASRAPSPWSPPPSPPDHKRSFWPNVFHRKGSHHRSQQNARCCTNGDKYFDPPPPQPPGCQGCPGVLQNFSAGSTTSLHPPNWTPFSNIFVGGSDYLCDALYAHVVAYNYISCLCGRGIRLVEFERPKSAHAKQLEQQEALEPSRVPKKAATLLGLSYFALETVLAAAEENGARDNEREKMRRGTVPGLVHEPEPIASPELHGDKNSLRELQEALGGCIAKIVSALRQGEAGKVGTGCLIKGAKVPYLDPMFLRALCEIVRCSEGACSKSPQNPIP
ncbi:uncharacterized protein MKZ38_007517 [Zalerion maritima]|uniref:Uncharacterized protein n=1 Tax=Zalerion maritima TaxID=339359 RepID=A0AAD5RME5_9PEZI|nr:uncharacterized protein MKZ38_007517 [Zalerion maritima]